MSKMFYFKQFCLITQFSSISPIDRTLSNATPPGWIEPGSDGMKGHSAFPTTSALLEPHHLMVYCHKKDIRFGGVLPPRREAVAAFYSPSRLEKNQPL